jgi:hypothetical protein
MSDTLICPHCGEEIIITEVIKKQLKQESEQKYQKQLELMEQKTQTKLDEIKKKEQELDKQHQNIEAEVKELAAQERGKIEAELKKTLWEKAQQSANQNSDLELKDLKSQLAERQKLQKEAENRELELRKKQRDLEEKSRQMDIEMERKLDKERQKISEQVQKQAEDSMRLKMLEKEKQLSDTQKMLEEARRKASQGSQQTQGEVLELDFEENLKKQFLHDKIEPVGKGVSGADIIQTVKTNTGSNCGVILWEIKQTKNWTEGWIAKFKDDLRAQKANIAVLVSIALPKGVQSFGRYKGIWVVSPSYATQLAIALRSNLLSVAYERAISAGKGEKQELLFNYITSHEFRQRVEALVELHQEMHTQIIKERTAFERSWKQREMQLQRLMLSTSGMYGEMQGLVGTALQEIKGLELEDGEDSNKSNQLEAKNQEK